jgi:O-antigen/teichoic acid export membrane protein
MRKPLIELASAIAGRAISAFGVLAISIVLSRQLSLAEAGSFFFGFTILMGMAIVARVGQELRLLRSVARQSGAGTERTELWTSLKIVVAASLALSAPFFVLWAVLPQESPLTLIWLALLPTAVTNVTASYLKGRGYNGLGALSEVGNVSLVACAWYLAFPAASAVEAWRVLSVVSWAVAGAWLLGTVNGLRCEERPSGEWRKFVHDARHLWAVAILSYLAQWGVLMIVMLALARDSVAVLNALLRLLAPLQFIVLTLDFFLAPRFARKRNVEILRTRRRGVAACLTLATPYALAVLIWPNVLLATIYGSRYAGYGLELQILAVGIILQMSLGANGILLNMLSEDAAMTKSVILRFIIASSIQLILFFKGVLWIGCLSLSISLVMQALYLRRKVTRALHRRQEADLVSQFGSSGEVHDKRGNLAGL